MQRLYTHAAGWNAEVHIFSFSNFPHNRFCTLVSAESDRELHCYNDLSSENDVRDTEYDLSMVATWTVRLVDDKR